LKKVSFNTFISFYDFNTSPLTKSPPRGITGHTNKMHKRRQGVCTKDDRCIKHKRRQMTTTVWKRW